MTTGPRPADVPFDHAAAQAALDALDASARVLGAADTARGTTSSTARDHFVGGHATSFTETDGALATESTTADEAITALRAAIATAMTQAVAAQAEAMAAQEAWDAANRPPVPGGPHVPR